MVTILGFDEERNARAVEMEDGDREEIEQHLEQEGWTSLIFLEK